YGLQWVLGGKTQFSFYAAPLVPPGAVTLGVMAYDIIKWEYFERSLRMYWEWIKGILEQIKETFERIKASLRSPK
ncbi:dolichyl-phosphate-mannose--protein mannosyltransferase, partial [Thermococci archaeon]